MVSFGLDGSRVSQPELEYLNNKIKERNANSKLIWLREAKKEGVLVAWIKLLDELVADPTEKNLVHLSINLEAILGLKGVSTNCLASGIKTEDSI